jgi:hypothetical protein
LVGKESKQSIEMDSKCGTRITLACFAIIIVVVIILLLVFLLTRRKSGTSHFQFGTYQPLYSGQGKKQDRTLQNIFNWGYRGNDTATFIGNNTQNTPSGCNTTMDSSSSVDETDYVEQDFFDLIEPFRYNTSSSSTSSSSSRSRKKISDSSFSDSFRIPKSYSKCVTPFGVDVTDPSIYRFSRGSPRVEYLEKDPQKDYSLSTMIRGDLSFPNAGTTCMVGRSRYGQKSLTKNGLFSPNADLRWYKLTSCNTKDYCTKVDGLKKQTHVRRICTPRDSGPYDSSSPC